MQSLSLQFDKNEVYIFATCAWLIWFARNKLRHKGATMTDNMIALQALHLRRIPKDSSESFSSSMLPHVASSSCFSKPTNYGFLKVNTDLAYSESKISISILVRNHMGFLLLLNAFPVSTSSLLSMVNY